MYVLYTSHQQNTLVFFFFIHFFSGVPERIIISTTGLKYTHTNTTYNRTTIYHGDVEILSVPHTHHDANRNLR